MIYGILVYAMEIVHCCKKSSLRCSELSSNHDSVFSQLIIFSCFLHLFVLQQPYFVLLFHFPSSSKLCCRSFFISSSWFSFLAIYILPLSSLIKDFDQHKCLYLRMCFVLPRYILCSFTSWYRLGSDLPLSWFHWRINSRSWRIVLEKCCDISLLLLLLWCHHCDRNTGINPLYEKLKKKAKLSLHEIIKWFHSYIFTSRNNKMISKPIFLFMK